MNATMTVDEYRRAVATDTLPTRYAKKGAVNVVLETGEKKERQHIEDDHTEMVAQYLEILMMR